MCLYMWNADISDVNLKAVAEFSQIYHVLSYPLYIEQKCFFVKNLLTMYKHKYNHKRF